MALVSVALSTSHAATAPAPEKPPLGLPPIPYPDGTPPSPEEIALGDKLFHDARFSANHSERKIINAMDIFLQPDVIFFLF